MKERRWLNAVSTNEYREPFSCMMYSDLLRISTTISTLMFQSVKFETHFTFIHTEIKVTNKILTK